MRTSESRNHRRRAKKMTGYYECSVCRYISERYYNVIRHEIRIHTASVKQRLCCNLKFVTKGDYYLHCQECHPVSRPANFTSRTKYRIDSGLKKINPPKLSEAKEKEEIKENVGRARYMLRTRNNEKLSKYKDEEDDTVEDSESSEAFESQSSFDCSSSDPPSQGPSNYEEKNQFSNANERTDVLKDEKCAENDSNKSLDFDEPSNEEILENNNKNNATTESGFCEDLTISTNIEIEDENPPIERIDWSNDLKYVENNEQIKSDFVESNLKSKTIEWCENLENVTKLQKKNDVTESSHELPIKKRILRLITNIEPHGPSHEILGKSITDRLHDRLKCKNTVAMKSRKKSRRTGQSSKNKKSRDTRDNKENVDPSSLSVNGYKNDENQIGTIEIHVDPRISFQNLTQDHREFFERLLSNQLLHDRINCCI